MREGRQGVAPLRAGEGEGRMQGGQPTSTLWSVEASRQAGVNRCMFGTGDMLVPSETRPLSGSKSRPFSSSETRPAAPRFDNDPPLCSVQTAPPRSSAAPRPASPALRGQPRQQIGTQ